MKFKLVIITGLSLIGLNACCDYCVSKIPGLRDVPAWDEDNEPDEPIKLYKVCK